MVRNIVFLFLLVLFSATSAQAAPVILKLGHAVEPTNHYAQAAVIFADAVKKKTDGSVEIQIFPNNQLGNQRDMIEGMIFGTVDMALCTTAVLGNFVPEMGVFDLPFLFRDREHAHKALDTIGMELGKLSEAKGVKVLAMMENGLRNMSNSKRPIRVPDDMKGLKMRVMEQPIYIRMMELLGASPTPMAWSEVYTSLQKGVIDGQENPVATVVTSRLFEVQKYVSLTAHTYSAEPLLMGVLAWNKLNAEQQKAVQEAANEALIWERDLCRELEAKYVAELNAGGKCQVNSDVDRAAFAEKTKSTWKMYADKVKGGDELITRILAVQ